jgi:hypothetical protein
MSIKTLLLLLATTLVVGSQTLLPAQSAHAKGKLPDESVVAADLLSVLALKTPSTFKFDESFGWVTGSDSAGLFIEKNKISNLEMSKSEAVIMSIDLAKTFRSLAPANIDAALLQKNYPAAWKDTRSEVVMQKILTGKRVGALLSPGKARVLFVATDEGTIYYVDHSLAEAPSFTRLVPARTPKIAAPTKPRDSAKVDDYVNNLPPCSSGKFPCTN